MGWAGSYSASRTTAPTVKLSRVSTTGARRLRGPPEADSGNWQCHKGCSGRGWTSPPSTARDGRRVGQDAGPGAGVAAGAAAPVVPRTTGRRRDGRPRVGWATPQAAPLQTNSL